MKYLLRNKLILTLLLCCNVFCVAQSENSLAYERIDSLHSASLKQKRVIVKELENNLGEGSIATLQALLESKLYYRKSDKKAVIIEHDFDDTFYIYDPLTMKSLGKVKKGAIKKIRTNNKLRSDIKNAIARLSLFSSDSEVRKASVMKLLPKLDANNIALLEEARQQESSKKVIDVMDVAFALYDYENQEKQSVRLAALDVMDGRLEPEVRSLVSTILAKDEQGNYIEKDTLLIKKALQVESSIQSKITFYGFVEKLFFGISLGSVLLLVATGLAITFGVMGVINMAHGELIMLGAYTTYTIQLLLPELIEYSVLIAIPVAFVVSGMVGILIERTVIRFLHGRPLETLLATFGISLILQQLVRSIFSPLNRQVESPSWLSGSLEINSVLSITYNRLYIIIFALIVFVLLQLILKKTSLGLHVRAVAQNRNMARSIGIRAQWVDALTFGLGSGIAGVAGVALSQLTNVGPNLGQSYIIDSFMVVVFGGVGNLWGTLVGGFTLGIANKFLEPVTGAVLANTLILIFIILFIQKRPKGLFPQKGRAAE